MRIFVDTEFSDFLEPELLSVALVPEDGSHEFYFEVSDFNRNLCSHFVHETVIPLMDMSAARPVDELRPALHAYLQQFNEAVLVIDYYGDWELIAPVLQGLPEKLKQARMLEPELDQVIKDLGVSAFEDRIHLITYGSNRMRDFFQEVDRRQHHALVDARASRHGFMEAVNEAKKLLARPVAIKP